MGQAAYNYDYTEVRRRKPRPQPQRKNNLRVEKGGKRRLTPLQAAMHHMMHLLSLGLLVGFAVALLWSEAQIVELSSEIRSAKATLLSEQSQNDYYTNTLDSRTNITNVEEAAGRLGLMKLDQSQITYIRLNGESVLVRRESAVRKWTDFLHAGALTLMGALNGAD